MTVLETPGFLRDAAAALTEAERLEVVTFLATNPEAGDAGHGRRAQASLASPRKGKLGGVRVIYYYHNESLPLFLLSVFAKNEKANLTTAEQNQMKILLPRLVAGYRNRMMP